MSVADVVTFVSVGIIGGAIIQYPLGYLSDLWDRRSVLLATCFGAMCAALAIGFLAGNDPLINFVAVFVFGSFAMPMFSLSAAHANDRAQKSEFVLVNAALMLFYSFGAIVGPLAASYMMELMGPSWLFFFCAAVYGGLMAVVLWRMQARSAVPAEGRGKFVAMLRTSPLFARLARRSGKDVNNGQ